MVSKLTDSEESDTAAPTSKKMLYLSHFPSH